MGILDNLGQYGDARTSLWIHRNILQKSEPRLRFEGFRAMLNLFDKDMVIEGHQLLDQATEQQDDYGHYKHLDPHAAYAYWGKLQRKMGKQPLLPAGRCRRGQALDQLNELTEAIHALTFGDNNTADFIRLTFALISGQHCALDPYAPYSRYCQQRDHFLAAIAQYRLDSQYIPGSFKQE